jgi:phage terminase small subunit
MLTPKQEKFVQGIIEGKSQADAYRSAYSAKNMSDNAIYREASLLMSSPKITQRLNELRQDMMTPAIMSAQERLELLTRIARGEEPEKDMRYENGELIEYERPASLRTRREAIDTINKMTGEYVQKVVADVDTTYSINIDLVDDDE